MSNVPTVKVDIGEDTYSLQFTLRAMKMFSSLGLMSGEVEESKMIEHFGDIVFAMLIPKDRDRVGEASELDDLLHMSQIGPISVAINKLRDLSMPDAKPAKRKKTEDKNAPLALTGTDSGQ